MKHIFIALSEQSPKKEIPIIWAIYLITYLQFAFIECVELSNVTYIPPTFIWLGKDLKLTFLVYFLLFMVSPLQKVN